LERAQDCLEHLVGPRQNIVITVSHDPIALALKKCRSSRIGLHLVGMLAAINFDDQFCGGTQEIGPKAGERRLSPELPAFEPPRTDARPDAFFCL
jgi:hypothetical protein